MRQRWQDYDRAADHGPLALAVKSTIGLTILAVLVGGIAYGLGWIGETAGVARREFGASAALRKYEWFKDAAAQLDRKRADIEVFRGRIVALEETYKALPRHQWPREDREQHSLWQSEVAGVTSSYNGLAAEYNAAMAKDNWKWANAGDLPAGAPLSLPRDYKPYAIQ